MRASDALGNIQQKRKTHLLCDVLAAFQVVISIRQDLRLYDGDDAMLAKDSRHRQGNSNTGNF